MKMQKRHTYVILFLGLALLLTVSLSVVPRQEVNGASLQYGYSVAANYEARYVCRLHTYRRKGHEEHSTRRYEQKRPVDLPRPIPVTPYPLAQQQHMLKHDTGKHDV